MGVTHVLTVLAGAVIAASPAATRITSGSAIVTLAEDLHGFRSLAPPDVPALNLLASDEPLYVLDLVQPDGAHLFVNATQAGAVRCDTVGAVKRLRFQPSDTHPASVVCSLSPGADGSLLGRIEVEPEAGYAVVGVEFPVVAVRLPLGAESADDELVLPASDGCVIQDPSVALKVGASWTLSYPGSLTAQFLAVGSPNAGVYIACQDAQGFTKRMSFRRTDPGVRLSATHLFPREAGRPQRVTYPVVVRCYKGRWTAVANLYKAWALKQPWCRRKLVERHDLPQWLLRGPFFHAVSVRQRPTGDTPADFLSRLPEYIRHYGEALDWPICAMIMAWEKHGPWVTPDYFPPFGGDEAFIHATKSILDSGHNTLVFLSGLKWTLEKAGLGPSNREEFERRGRTQAVVGEDGAVQILGEPDQDVGRYAQICPATPLAREILTGATVRCLELGIQCIQVDQIVGGAMPPCYSTSHGHPAGYGRWLTQAVYDVFAEVVAEGKKHSRDYAFAIEEPHEFFIPLLDCYHARDYQFGRWPRNGPGRPYPIPLFTYLYHEYCLGYGGDSASLHDKPSLYLTLGQALNALTGKTPGGCVWGRALEPDAVDPTILGFTRQHCNLLRAGVGKWLLLGRMVDWDFVGGPTVNVRAGEQDFQFHTVQSSAWLAEDGTQAWLLANVGAEPLEANVTLQGYGVTYGGSVDITAVSGASGASSVLAEHLVLPGEASVSLPPYSLLLLHTEGL